MRAVNEAIHQYFYCYSSDLWFDIGGIQNYQICEIYHLFIDHLDVPPQQTHLNMRRLVKIQFPRIVQDCKTTFNFIQLILPPKISCIVY